MRRESLATPREPEEVGRRRTDVDDAVADIERACEPSPHLLSVRGNSRLLTDQDAVCVDEREAGLAHLPICLCQKDE